MEGAKAAEVLPGLLQTHILPHHADNIRLLFYLLRE